MTDSERIDRLDACFRKTLLMLESISLKLDRLFEVLEIDQKGGSND